MTLLKDKTILITGSARGLGRQVALGVANKDVKIAVNYMNSKAEAELCVTELQNAGAQAMAVQADVTNEKSVQTMFDTIQNSFGGVDVLVNMVGAFVFKDFDSTTSLEWQQMFDSNLHSCYYCCKAALPYMRTQKWGRIINVGIANAGIRAFRNVVPYTIAKTGVHILTKSLAAQEAANGITVNVLAPGLMDNGRLSLEQIVIQEKVIPVGRLGNGDDLAGAVLYLCSDGAGYVTGAEVPVSGGWGL